MKKKLALLMAAIMTVAMVPMTAFAAATTDINAVDQVKTAVDAEFTSRVEVKKDEDATPLVGEMNSEFGTNTFDVVVTLDNAEFAQREDNNGDEYYVMEATGTTPNAAGVKYGENGVWAVDVKNSTTAYVTLDVAGFNTVGCTLPIIAKALDKGDVTVKFSTNNTVFADVKEVIAVASEEEVLVATEGVVTFVEDSTNIKNLKDITIDGLVNNAIGDATITLKLKGNYEFCVDDTGNGYLQTVKDGKLERLLLNDAVTFLNDEGKVVTGTADTDSEVTEDEIKIVLSGVKKDQITMIRISGIALKATKKCNPGDVATITVSSKAFDGSTKLEVAKMVEEAVTYTVEDDDLPVIWAGKAYDEENTLKVSVEENTGDILNTSRKATFTFPDGIEVVGVKMKNAPDVTNGSKSEVMTDNANLEIDENVVTIWNYQKKSGVPESDPEKGKVDFEIEFVLNAAPSFSGDVDVTLGGEFDDVELTVATVKAPYTVEAKTSEVLIDYRYVPVNEIVITEAEEGILEENDKIYLEVEKMDFEDAGTYEVTTGDIEVDVNIVDGQKNTAQLEIEVTDESTEASTITISGLELYLDRTLPVGGYALENVGNWDRKDDERVNAAANILWENSYSDETTDKAHVGYEENGIFKYDAVVCNDSYVEVVTAGRDQDDSSTTRKIVITIGATTMAVGTETVTLDTPAYINAENYTELPLRAVSEAFGATVGWDDASRTVTIMMGQRIVSMTIGSKTMYINGTPVAMNTAPEITNERTFVPVRDLANALGITKIDWNEASATVTLN